MERKQPTRKVSRSLIPTEAQEQRALVRWVRLQPEIKEYIVKLNNEGQRSEAQGWNLKMLGMCQGASDLFLMVPRHQADQTWFHGFWLEQKRNRHYSPSERKTPTWIAQEIFQANARKMGYAAEFCYGWEHGARLIKEYLAGTYKPEYNVK